VTGGELRELLQILKVMIENLTGGEESFDSSFTILRRRRAGTVGGPADVEPELVPVSGGSVAEALNQNKRGGGCNGYVGHVGRPRVRGDSSLRKSSRIAEDLEYGVADNRRLGGRSWIKHAAPWHER